MPSFLITGVNWEHRSGSALRLFYTDLKQLAMGHVQTAGAGTAALRSKGDVSLLFFRNLAARLSAPTPCRCIAALILLPTRWAIVRDQAALPLFLTLIVHGWQVTSLNLNKFFLSYFRVFSSALRRGKKGVFSCLVWEPLWLIAKDCALTILPLCREEEKIVGCPLV